MFYNHHKRYAKVPIIDVLSNKSHSILAKGIVLWMLSATKQSKFPHFMDVFDWGEGIHTNIPPSHIAPLLKNSPEGYFIF